MIIFVDADWVEKNTDTTGLVLLDPRRPMKYLQGHIKKAINVPISGAFNKDMELRAEKDLAQWLGGSGLDNSLAPVIYDSYDGQNGSMLAWILEYLGCPVVRLMNVFYERWKEEAREVFYRPVISQRREFEPKSDPKIRATLQDIKEKTDLKLIDLRSLEEYTGAVDTEGKPGHIPKAMNIPWKHFLADDGKFLASRETMERLISRSGIQTSDPIVGYCRFGLRAAVGYIALKELGLKVRLYDGSFAEWARSGLPVER
jgi:thiosulfate/3-mercaptopyruvate sulfurtransferase